MSFRKTVFLLVLCFFLPACDEQEDPQTLTVGVLMYGDSRQEQVDGFIAGLNDFGYTKNKNIHYIIRNAKNNRSRLNEFVVEFQHLKVDLIASAGGLETDALQQVFSTTDIPQQDNIPVVVLYINSIIERGTVKKRDHAGWNVTGVDNLNAEVSAKRLALLHELLPEAKKVLILYYPKIAPSRIGYEKALAAAPSLGIEIDARAVNSMADIQQVMQSLKPGEVDAMLTVPTAPIDNALAKIILPLANALSIPVFTHSRKLASLGAVASYGAKFSAMGKQASRLANKVFQGIEPRHIPFETPKHFLYTLNWRAFNQFGKSLSAASRLQIEDYIEE
jgi:putative ABC transport system substrate-binding protein